MRLYPCLTGCCESSVQGPPCRFPCPNKVLRPNILQSVRPHARGDCSRRTGRNQLRRLPPRYPSGQWPRWCHCQTRYGLSQGSLPMICEAANLPWDLLPGQKHIYTMPPHRFPSNDGELFCLYCLSYLQSQVNPPLGPSPCADPFPLWTGACRRPSYPWPGQCEAWRSRCRQCRALPLQW